MSQMRATWEPGLGDHLRTIWRYKWFLLGGAVVIAEIAFVLLSLAEPRYEAEASLRLTVRTDAGLLLDEAEVEYAARIYAELAESPRLLLRASEISGLTLSRTEARALTDVDWARPPGFIDVTASGPTPEDAANLADGMATPVVEAIVEDSSTAVGGIAEVPQGLYLSAEVVETAIVPTDPAAPNPLRDAVAVFIISLVVLAEAVALWRPARGLLPLSQTAERVTDLVGVPCLTLTGDPEDRTRMALFAARHLGDKSAALVVQCQGDPLPAASVRLAEAIADTGRRVLVIDGDGPSPALHRRLGLPQGPGLAEVLAGERELNDAVFATASGSDLAVLTAGGSNGSRPTLPGSGLLERLGASGEFQFVIVNLAATAVPDTLTTAAAEIRQSTILVIDPETTKRRELSELVHGFGGQDDVVAVLLLSKDAAATDTKRLAARWWDRASGQHRRAANQSPTTSSPRASKGSTGRSSTPSAAGKPEAETTS